MTGVSVHKHMIAQVVAHLGPELTNEVAFVGGCTTGLLLSDSFALEGVRHTDDVDLIVHVVGRGAWYNFQQKLRERGFREITDEEAPICAMRCGELRVDFMPDEPSILGFSNRWYKEALESAIAYEIDGNSTIRLVRPEYFVATKLEAYLGRGNGDPLSSRDIEDLLSIFDGRASIVAELGSSNPELRSYVQTTIAAILKENDFDYAIQDASRSDHGRYDLILERLKSVADGTFRGR